MKAKRNDRGQSQARVRVGRKFALAVATAVVLTFLLVFLAWAPRDSAESLVRIRYIVPRDYFGELWLVDGDGTPLVDSSGTATIAFNRDGVAHMMAPVSTVGAVRPLAEVAAERVGGDPLEVRVNSFEASASAPLAFWLLGGRTRGVSNRQTLTFFVGTGRELLQHRKESIERPDRERPLGGVR